MGSRVRDATYAAAMTAQTPSSAGGPRLAGPRDPEHDPRASYALEPEYVENLTRRIVATTGGDRPRRTPR